MQERDVSPPWPERQTLIQTSEFKSSAMTSHGWQPTVMTGESSELRLWNRKNEPYRASLDQLLKGLTACASLLEPRDLLGYPRFISLTLDQKSRVLATVFPRSVGSFEQS